MSSLIALRLIADVEFASIVAQTDILGHKLRVHLFDTSYIDIWVSQKTIGRFAYHWERSHVDGSIYRYDNVPDTNWSAVATFPAHFHDGDQDTVVAAPFSPVPEQGLRDFMTYVRAKLAE